MMRVVIAAGTFLEREGIVRVLDGPGDLEVVACASSEGEAIAAVVRELPDVLITGVPMAPTYTDEGIRLAHRLRLDHPDIGVVVLSSGASATYAARLFALGAHGRAYLLAGRIASAAELIAAVRDVAAGGAVVDPT